MNGKILNSFDYDRDLRLPERLVRQLLTVTPQLRRAHIGCFPGLGQDQAKNDDIFYPHLTEILNGNLDPILRFDSLMQREKKLEKAFSWRARKALVPSFERQDPEGDDAEFLSSKAADPDLPIETRQLAFFMSRMIRARHDRTAAKSQEGSPQDLPTQYLSGDRPQTFLPIAEAADGEGEGWARGTAALADLLERAGAPDPELAQLMLAQVEALVACAERFRTKSLERNRLAERFVALRSRLDDCLTPQERMTVTLPPALPIDFDLADLEQLLAETERTTRGLAEAERASLALKEAVARANDAEDMAEVERLTPQRIAAIAEHQAAKVGRGVRVSEMVQWLAERSGAFAAAEPAPSTAPEPMVEVSGSTVEDAHDVVLSEAKLTTVGEELAPEPPAADVPTEEAAASGGEAAAEGVLEPVAVAPTAAPFEEISPAMDEAPNLAAAGDLAAFAPSAAEHPYAEGAEAVLAPAEGWGSGQTMAELLAGYLRRGETVFAADLLDLAEARGVDVPIPGAFLRALHESRMALQPHENVNSRLTGALDEAVAGLATLEAAADEERAALMRRLAVAALLRPALFGAYGAARLLLRQMRLTGPERLLAKVLADLGYEVHLTFDELRGLAGHARTQRLPELNARLKAVLEVNRHKKLNYQPASELLRRLFDAGGEIGRAFERAIANDPGAIEDVETLLGRMAADSNGVPDYIEARANEIMARSAPIEGNALRMLCKLTEAAGELLGEWVGAAKAELGKTNNRRRIILETSVGQVRKAAEALLVELGSDPGVGLVGAVAVALRRAVVDLIHLCQGQEPDMPPPRLASGFNADLLRLTGGAQPRHDNDPAYHQEVRDQGDALYAGLRRPQSQAHDLSAAFWARLEDGATLAAHDILLLARRAPQFTPGLNLAQAADKLENTVEELRSARQTEVESLTSRLAMLWHLAGEDRDQISNAMQQLSVIGSALRADPNGVLDEATIPALNGRRSPVVPPDFPELQRVLVQIKSLIERRNTQILADQRRRLEDLARQEAHRDRAVQLLTRLADFDPVTVDSMIGQIQDGLPIAAIESKSPDSFTRFHPDFVSTIAGSSGTAVKLVEGTLQGKNPLGLPPYAYGPDQEKHALELMRFWQSFTAAMRSANADQLRIQLMNVLGTLGFVRGKLENGAQLIRNRLHRFTLSASLQMGREQFLPPIYGSEARGLYNILIADEGLRDKELAAHLGSMGRDRPSFLIVLGRLDRRRRESLAHELRLERQTAVLLDESLIVYVALSEGEPLETLFACGLPFGYIQPYTTNPRSIPPEMFFGRKDEIQKITARQNGGCLVYGGRQLGKSALLNHVKRLVDQLEGDRRAIYLDIKPIGGRGMPADRIWRALAEELAQADVFDLKDYTAESFRNEMRRWIEAKPGRQLLVMLDEADNFLAAEARQGRYANLQMLKDLMETLHWDFKVVFAGLHNVRRMSRAPNSPLPHLGTPICIGPLDSNADNLAEARRLVTAPMRAAGYDYADPSLAFSILARVNYYPSLVQVFCQAVVENAGKARRTLGSGPYWKLGNAELFEGAVGRTINAEIQKRFQVTLELDWRYEAIAKVIALLGSEGPEGNTRILRSGLSAEEIRGMVIDFWPQQIPLLAPHDFRVLLEEMNDLGVLSQPSEGLFVLRNAQVAQLLGSRDDLEQALLTAMAREEQVDYDAATFHSPYVAHAPEECAPLTDGQLDALLEDEVNRGKVGAIVVQPEMWNALNLKGLKDLIEMRSDQGRPLSVAFVAAKATAIRSQIDARLDHPRERRVLLIEGEWDAKAAQFLADHVRVKEGIFRPIWLLRPAWLVQARRNRDLPSYVSFYCAQPWTAAMLRHWLDTHGLTRLDQPELRVALLEVTGGLPARLHAILPFLQEQTTHSVATLDPAIRNWQPPAGRDLVRPDLATLGFTPREAGKLKDLALELMTSEGETADASLLAEGGWNDLILSATDLGLLYRRHDRIALSPLGKLMTK